MAKDAETEPEWIERLMNGGNVKCPSGWASPPGDTFMVRGPNYFTTKAKIPGGDYLLKPLGFDWIKGPTKISEVLGNPNSRIRRVIDDVFSDGNRPLLWAFNLQIPTRENYSAVAYFVLTEPVPEGSLIDQFLKGDDLYRNSRLKMIANIVKGPWIIRKAVGEQAVCRIGRALTCKYQVSENFCEVDLDIGSSMVANAIVHVAKDINMLTVDLAFLIESQTESELPERILGAFRFSEPLDPASAGTIEVSDNARTSRLKHSLSTPLWNLIEHGYTTLVSPGAQEKSSTSNSKHPSVQLIVKIVLKALLNNKRHLLHMAREAETEPEWIERLINGGNVKCPSGWASPPGDTFMVRGPNYFTTKAKIPGGDYLLKPLGFDWIKGPTKISEVLGNPNSRIRRVVDDVFSDGNRPLLWAFNLQIPTKENYSAVAYFVLTEPVPEGSLIDHFLKGDDLYRNSRLKMIANIVKGPWIVRKAVGEQAVCRIGRALTCKYQVSENFCEVDLDIGSSMVANAIVHVAKDINMLTVDLAFLIESQTESELPERILGAFRFSGPLDPASAGTIEVSDNARTSRLKPSLSTRSWNSIGHGYTTFVSPGAQENSSTSNSKHPSVQLITKIVLKALLNNKRHLSHMARDAETEPEWIERLINGGNVKCPSGWASPPGDTFMVRGPNYFTTKAKIPGGDYLLKPLGFDWIKGPTKISEVLGNPNSRIRRVVDDVFSDGNRPLLWAFNLQIPTKENYSAVAYFVLTEPVPEGSLIDQFLKGDDLYRNSRLKMIANIVKGPWIVRKAVGEQAVCRIGRALTCKYQVSENFCEVDLDIGSSMVANAIVHVAKDINMLTVDLAFLIESQTKSELPERILGAFRFSGPLDPASAGTIEVSDNSRTNRLKSSLSTRLYHSCYSGCSRE